MGMLKGTPLGAVLDGIGVLYWFVLLAAVYTVVVRGRTRRGRVMGVAVVLGLMVGPMLLFMLPDAIESSRAKARLKVSYALFNERCKSAGETIHKTIGNVDGVVWMKWRPPSLELYGQYVLDDPYGYDCGAEGCILELLRVSDGNELNPERALEHGGRYAFVESVDPADGKMYRYVAVIGPRGNWTEQKIKAEEARTGKPIESYVYGVVLKRMPIRQFVSQYGISWSDISTREDRDHWIAGGSLKVVDLQTREVIAERIGYMMDAGQGNTSGGRSPWSHADELACPAKQDKSGDSTRIGFTNRFVQSVLNPPSGSTK